MNPFKGTYMEMIERATALEKKVENLEQIFNTADKTMIEVKAIETTLVDDEIDELNMLKQDFQIIRNTVISTIERASRVITALTPSIEMDPTASGSLISSYSELVNSINSSAKMLSDMYKNLVEIKKKATEGTQKETSTTTKVLSVGEITRMISSKK